MCTLIITVFPQNLTLARFYFRAQSGAATIRGRLDFKGGVYRDRRARACTASIISLYLYTCMMCVRIRIIAGDPLPCGEISRAAFIGMSSQKRARHFEGGGISRCGKISRKYGMYYICTYDLYVCR